MWLNLWLVVPTGGLGLGGGSERPRLLVVVLSWFSLSLRYSSSGSALDPSHRLAKLLLDGEGDLVDLGVPSDEVAAGDLDLDLALAPP